MGSEPPQSATDLARRELSELRGQALVARRELGRLHRAVAKQKAHAASGPDGVLQAANEQLLLATLRTQDQLDAYEQALEAAARNATRDPLTQLPNRARLFERLDQAIASARDRLTRVAVLFLDLNDFKRINDLLGHATGDEFLRLAAQRIAAAAGPQVFVARYGGDEFVVLLDELGDHDAADMANRLMQGLEGPCMAGEHELKVGASIGISVYPEDGDTQVTLLQHADAAMYCAKRKASGFMFYGQCSASDMGSRHPALASRPAAHAPRGEDPHESLREANSQLVLAALGAQELQAAAEQAFQRQNELLAIVAHELRNPLTPISMAGSMLSLVPNGRLPQMQEIIEREVRHMTRLIGDLVDLSRVRTGKLRILKEPVDLVAIIEAAVPACVPAITTRGQRLEVQLPPGTLTIQGDATRLSQVVRNLLDNASKYTPEAGRIGLVLRTTGDQAVIVVSDSGIGISPDALQRIFDPFVQDSHAVGFNGAGLGIGLTVVREIIVAHGGSITATSAGIGLGCEFAISLPLSGQPDGPSPAASQEAPQEG